MTRVPLAEDPEPSPVGGVHVKYLVWCPRQLWLYANGFRPESRSELVQAGEALDEATFTRFRGVDLGSARLDRTSRGTVVHETKSSRRPAEQHYAQVRHYCLLLERVGLDVAGGVLHYPAVRRTAQVVWDDAQRAAAQGREREVLAVLAADRAPPRKAFAACRGCSYTDYCWGT